MSGTEKQGPAVSKISEFFKKVGDNLKEELGDLEKNEKVKAALEKFERAGEVIGIAIDESDESLAKAFEEVMPRIQSAVEEVGPRFKEALSKAGKILKSINTESPKPGNGIITDEVAKAMAEELCTLRRAGMSHDDALKTVHTKYGIG